VAVFADTAYYIALLFDADALHDLALSRGGASPATNTVTTDAVLVEVLSYCSRRGLAVRQSAVGLIDELRTSPAVTIVHQTPELFFAGVDLYRRRLDKGYSLTDCMSMIVCREQNLGDVLTHDRHFEQEGFTILL